MPVYTVSQLNSRVKDLLEKEFAEVLVEGEVSSWRTYPSGHAYFDIKDAGAKVGAVMFSGRRRFLRFEPEDGMRVLVRGRVTLYERGGRFQLSVLSMEPLGEGALEAAFRQLMERLEMAQQHAQYVWSTRTGCGCLTTIAKRCHPDQPHFHPPPAFSTRLRFPFSFSPANVRLGPLKLNHPKIAMPPPIQN